MKNYYNSNSVFEANDRYHFSYLASLLGKSKSIMSLFLFMILALSQLSWAQSTANYTFSTNVTSSLVLDANSNPIDMSTGTTQLVGPGLDAAASPVTNIGFPFLFMGNAFTQFAVQEDGILQLGGTAPPTNTYSITGGSATAPRLAAFNADMRTGTTTGKIHYKLVGSAPNRVLVVEFKDMTLYYTGTAAAGNSTFQMRLYENGNIEYVYGTMNVTVGTPASGMSIGFYTGAAAGSFASVAYLTNTNTTTGTYTANTSPATLGAVANLDSAADGSRRAYSYVAAGNSGSTITTSLAPPTALTFGTVTPSSVQLNWTAATPTTGIVRYLISRSADGGATYTVAGTTALGTNTFTATGLLPLTSYLFKVNAISEGARSADLTGTQATGAIMTYVWNATTGSAVWTNPTSWTPDRNTPDATDILQFSNGGTSIATGITTQTVSRLEFSNNTTTSFQSAATATLTSNRLVIPAGSTLFSDGPTAALTLASSTGAVNTIDGRLEINNSTFANTITFANSVTTVGTTGTLAAGGILAGAITGTATTLVINGTYEHKYTTVAGTIPTATWANTSNTNIIGYTTNTNATGGFTQNFNNFTWNCPAQTGNLNLASTGTTGAVGTFTVTSTGTGSLRWTGTGGYTVNANNYSQTGGTFDLASGASGTGTFNVAGVFNKTGGTFQSSGTATSNPTLHFNGTTMQSVSFDSQPTGPITYRISNPIGITLNGSFATTFSLGNGVLGGLRISTLSATPIVLGGTLASFSYNAANSRLTYDYTGSGTATSLEFPATNGPANLTVGIGTGNILTLPFSRSLSATTANSVLTMTSGDIDISSNTLTLGASAAFPGTLTYTAGGIRTTTGSFVRWFPTTGLPTTAGTGIGFYPIQNGSSNRNVALSFSTATALTTGGTIGLSHANIAGLSAVSPAILDVAYSVDTRTNSSWTAVTGNGIAASGTVNLRLTGGNSFLTPTVANLRVIQGTTALGTHVAGTGTNPNFQANRSGLTLADLGSTHYIGAAAADILNSFTAVVSGNWNAPATWSSGIVPSCADAVTIAAGVTVTVNSAANNARNITIASGATLVVASGDLTAGCTLFNNFITNNGTLTITGGTLTVNGNILNNAGSVFNHSGGDIVIDGNNGVTAESVATGTSLLNFSSNNVNLTGGKITIVDPHLFSTTTTNYAVVMINGTAVTNTLTTSPNHTFQFGDGVSTQSGGTGGFSIDNWNSTTYLAFGKILVKGPTAATRFVTSRYNFTANGDIVVENGGAINFAVPLFFGRNIDVQTGGTFINVSATTTGIITSNTLSALTPAPVTVPQAITNNGTLINSATAATANFTSLAINNTNATGVTLNSPFSTLALTLTAGPVNTTTANLLTLGSATAAGTLTGGSATSFVNGPLARTIGNGNANTSYIAFPIGKGAVYSPIALAPSTTSVAQFSAETFNTNTGTTDLTLTGLSSGKRWESSALSGTYTDINVRLGDSGITATSIPAQAPAAAGVYTNSFGPTATFAAGTPNTTTSSTAVIAAAFTGFLSYAVNNLCLGTPTPGATTATANALCSGQSTTLGFTNASTGVGLTYQWQSSVDNVTFTDIAAATSATYTVTPTSVLYYQVIVTCATGGTSGTSTPLQITFANSITGTTPATICGQGTASLAATGSAGTVLNWYATPTSTTPLATGSPFVTPVITADTTYYVSASSSVVGPGTVAIGTGTTLTGATEQPTAFCNRWPSYISQTIYTAAELTAQGLSAGNITSMAYNITTLGDGATNDNFNVKIGTTALSNFANTTLLSTTAFTDVYGPSTYTHTATGLQTITFSTPFVWDGTSNIVVYTSMSGADNINNSQTYYTVTPDNKLLWQRSGSTATNTLTNRRLNLVFGGQASVACNSVRVPVVATVTAPPALTLSTTAVTICSGQTSSPITITAGGSAYDTYSFSPSTGVSGTAGTGFSFNPTTTTTYTLTASQSSGTLCSLSQTIVVTVNQTPTALTLTSPVTTCPNTISTLVATGGTLSNISILSENFNAATNNWTTVNTTTGGTPANAAWTLRPDNYAYPFYATWHSNDNSQFYLTNSDAAGNGSTTNTSLQSPAFSTTNFTAVDINFYNYLYDPLPASTTAKVQASTDGTTWVDLQTITPSTSNTATPFTLSTVALTPAFLNQPTVYVRFNYSGVWRYFWGIDNVSIAGTQSTAVVWSPTTNLFTDAAATIAYTGTPATTVYHMATAASNTTYTATATSAATCSSTGTTSVTVNAPSAQPTATSPQSINDPATIANIAITGTNVVWYASSANAIAGTGALASTTPLVNNTTYYATQTIGSGCPSTPIAVLVNVVLKNNSFDLGSLVYYPNPVIDNLNISYSNTISTIEVSNLIGQIVKTTRPNETTTQLDMSSLPTATYLVRVTSEGKTATIKVVKK